MGKLLVMRVALCVLLLAQSSTSFASVSVAVGMSNVYAGRLVPGLYGGWYGEHFGVFGTTSGVRSSVHYYNAYQLNLLWMWSPGDFLWGKLTAGFGLGIFYAKQAYKGVGVATDYYDDPTAGPAMRVSWLVVNPVFLCVEGMYGMRDPGKIFEMAPQDVVSMSLGVQL